MTFLLAASTRRFPPFLLWLPLSPLNMSKPVYSAVPQLIHDRRAQLPTSKGFIWYGIQNGATLRPQAHLGILSYATSKLFSWGFLLALHFNPYKYTTYLAIGLPCRTNANIYISIGMRFKSKMHVNIDTSHLIYEI